MSSSMFRYLRFAGLFVAAASAALADEGRVPIPFTSPVTTPISITAPGRYVLTRALMGPGTIIEIAASDVDLDLNGFAAASAPGGADPAVSVIGGPLSQVSLRNGAISGGSIGIGVAGGAARVAIEGVTVSDTGVGILLTAVASFSVRSSTILRTMGNAIVADGADRKQGTIAQNQIRVAAGGILVSRGSSVAIQDNRLEDISPSPSPLPEASGGIVLLDSDDCLVANNTIEDVTGTGGIGVRVKNTHGSKFYNNVIFRTREHGIHLDPNAFDNLILHNVILHAGWEGPVRFAEDNDEIRVESGVVGIPPTFSGGNDIDKNVLNRGSGHGLHFFGDDAGGNHFGRNTGVGNFGPPCPVMCPVFPCVTSPDWCDDGGEVGVRNYSFGDNLMPGPIGLF